jgi:hypothetical protein
MKGMAGERMLPDLRLEPTGLSGRVAEVVGPATEAAPGGSSPEPPGGSGASRWAAHF